jgi:hypothetical protein
MEPERRIICPNSPSRDYGCSASPTVSLFALFKRTLSYLHFCKTGRRIHATREQIIFSWRQRINILSFTRANLRFLHSCRSVLAPACHLLRSVEQTDRWRQHFTISTVVVPRLQIKRDCNQKFNRASWPSA